MAEQKRTISKLCLTGFILSVISPVLLIFINAFNSLWEVEIVYWCLFVFAILSPLAGLVLSIAGLIGARKGNKKGKGFGIAGIILTSVYAAVVLVVVLILGLIINTFSRHDTKKNIPTFYSNSEIVSVVYYYHEADGYRFEELDEDQLDDFVDDLYSMDIETGGMMDYYWGNSFGIEMELEDGTYMSYDGTRLELYEKSRMDDDFSYDYRKDSEYVYVVNYDFWDVAKEYFPSIEENGDNVFARQ